MTTSKFREGEQLLMTTTEGVRSDPAPVPEGPSTKTLSFQRRVRNHQIRFCSSWICTVSGVPAIASFFKAIRNIPVLSSVLAAITGYNRPFDTLKAAQAFIAGHDGGGHAHPYCAINEMRSIQQARPSDYAALFFLQPLAPLIRTVFDFGGSVGNLFYCYSKYLEFRNDFTWTVYDLPENVQLGERIAQDYGEDHLRFTSLLSESDGIDVFIATGALHYFATPLPDIIASFKKLPRYVLINRTPMTDSLPFATVQDAGRYRVACMVYNRNDLIRKFEACGYELVDDWRAAERSLLIPLHPDCSVNAYSGMFFRLGEGNDRLVNGPTSAHPQNVKK